MPTSTIQNKYNARTKSKIMSVIECRLFRNMPNITSLKYSKQFMNAQGDDGERAEIYTIYRTRDMCKGQQFKPVGHEGITKLLQISTMVITEEKTFCRFLDSRK